MTILSKKENSLGECRESNIFVEKQEKLNFGNEKGAPGYLESLGSKLSSYCEQIEVHFYTDYSDDFYHFPSFLSLPGICLNALRWRVHPVTVSTSPQLKVQNIKRRELSTDTKRPTLARDHPPLLCCSLRKSYSDLHLLFMPVNGVPNYYRKQIL